MGSMQVAATAVFLAAITTTGFPQQKPVTESPLIIEYFDVPATLEDATARADAIVRARSCRPPVPYASAPGAVRSGREHRLHPGYR